MTGHASWIVGFSRRDEAGEIERGWYADCSVHIRGCGWRGSDRTTEDEARADARDHDPASYDERVERTAEMSAKRVEDRARRAHSAEHQDYHEETLARLRDEVFAADRAWEADVGNAELRKAYNSAKAAFRAAEKAAIADDYTVPCGRCGGTGVVPPWGVCFACGGAKRWSYRPEKFQADPATRAKRMEKARVKQAAEDAAHQTALAKLPEAVRDALLDADEKLHASDYDALTREESFRADLAAKLRKYGSLSEKQVAAVERGLARDQERVMEKEALRDAAPLEAGRREIEGEILADKWAEDRGYGSQHKILVRQDDGNKLWGTVPRAIEDAIRPNVYGPDGAEPEVTELCGSRVRFTATVERSRDDDHFGFFKRPAKAEFVTTEED